MKLKFNIEVRKRRIRHVFHLIKVFLLYENKITPWLYLRLCKLHLIKPYMIIYVDGGICSQMHQYLLGCYYAEQGMKVAYDLGWYRRDGFDINHVFERKFEFCEMWPNHPFEVASEEKVTFYASLFQVQRNEMHFPLAVAPPKYFGGYYCFDDDKTYGELLRKVFPLELCKTPNKSNPVVEWEGTKCAVHVRRGDLAKMDVGVYGKVTEDYFRKAMAFVKDRYDKVCFYFFSDEIDWVEQKLVLYCADDEYVLMKGNKAWEDLCFMAYCDCFISSQGSAGKMAAMMNGKGMLIINDDPHDEVWSKRYDHTITIAN